MLKLVKGRLYFDSKRTLYFDGNHFMVRTKGHPDSRKIRSFSTNLETWLIDCIRERDPGLLNDTKWMYRNLWHELIRQMQVREIA